MVIRSSRTKAGVAGKKTVASKKTLAAAKKQSTASVPLKAGEASIAITLFGKLKETDPMYTATAIDALFTQQQTVIDEKENKKRLALETIKTIAALGQNSSLRETIAVVKTIGDMLQNLYNSMDTETAGS